MVTNAGLPSLSSIGPALLVLGFVTISPSNCTKTGLLSSILNVGKVA